MPRTPSTTSVVAYLVLVVVPRCMLLTALLFHGQLLWVQVDTGETQMHPQWLAGPFGHVQSNIDHLLSMPGCVDTHRVLRCLAARLTLLCFSHWDIQWWAAVETVVGTVRNTHNRGTCGYACGFSRHVCARGHARDLRQNKRFRQQHVVKHGPS